MANKLIKLSSSKIIKISGLDSERYLQGRLSQDISSLKQLSPLESLLLSPQGKILAQPLIWKSEDLFFLLIHECESFSTDSFISDLLQFKVADQLEAEPLDSQVYFFSENSQTSTSDQPVLRYPDLGHFYISNKELNAAEEQIWLELRTCLGKPLFGRDFTARHTVGILPLDKYVSFTKGCYTGQEIVEKSSALGRTNKKLVHLKSLSPKNLPSPGDHVLQHQESEQSDPPPSCGSITSAASDGSSNFCIALVKTEAAQSEQVIVGQDNWQVLAL